MAAAVVEDLEINQGEDWAYRWIAKDPTTGLPMDLTSWTGRGQIRPRAGSPTLLHTWTTVGGAGMTLGADGTVVITVSAATSSAWTWGGVEAHYDIELTGNGKTVRLAQGKAVLSLEVTI
jgi:hypothetical protein